MIEINAEALSRVNELLADMPGETEKVYAMAINRGLSRVKAKTKKEIRATYTAKASSINDRAAIQVKNASPKNIIGSVNFSGTKIPLYEFSVSPKRPSTGEEVKAIVKKGGSATPFQHAFIANAKNGLGVFERTSSKRLPIEEKMGLSVAQMASNEAVLDNTQEEVTELVIQRALHEMNRIIDGYKR